MLHSTDQFMAATGSLSTMIGGLIDRDVVFANCEPIGAGTIVSFAPATQLMTVPQSSGGPRTSMFVCKVVPASDSRVMLATGPEYLQKYFGCIGPGATADPIPAVRTIVVPTPLIAPSDPVIDGLAALLSLAPNWNDYGGVVPSVAAVSDARQFYHLLPADAATPAVEPSGDGEVNLVWRTAESYLEVGFYGDGVMSYYGKIRGEELLGDLEPLPAELPDDLRIALIAIGDASV